MYLSTTHQTAFPRCTKLLHCLSASLRADTKLFDAWIGACTEDADDKKQEMKARKIALDKGLAWGTGPRVGITKGMVNAPAGVKACGYTPTFTTTNLQHPNLLLVTSLWFDAFEFSGPEDATKNARRFTITVLHECIHWVRNEAGLRDDLFDDKGLLDDAGHVWEQRALSQFNCTLDNQIGAMDSIPESVYLQIYARPDSFYDQSSEGFFYAPAAKIKLNF
jgi:hypothetical protein